MINETALETSVRDWIAGVVGTGVPVIFGKQSAPRPAGPHVWVELHQVERHGHADERGLLALPITGVNQGTRTLTLAGDQTARLPAGRSLVVADSTGNDGTYMVQSSAFSSPNTSVVVVEAISSAVVNGVVTGIREVVGTRLVDMTVECLGGPAVERAEAILSSLELVATQDTLLTAGLAIYPAEAVRDLTGLYDTRHERRARLELHFATDSTLSEFVGTIEQVELTRTADEDGGGQRAATFQTVRI